MNTQSSDEKSREERIATAGDTLAFGIYHAGSTIPKEAHRLHWLLMAEKDREWWRAKADAARAIIAGGRPT